jgi:hypothetical protein
MTQLRSTPRGVTVYTMAIAVDIWLAVWAYAGEFPGVAILAVFWLLLLLLWGVFSPPFKPYPEDPRLPPGSQP